MREKTMTSDELREKVAKAICSSIGGDPDVVMVSNVPHWTDYTSEADAAIAVVLKAVFDIWDADEMADEDPYYTRALYKKLSALKSSGD
jgi:hypothetical protein